jgi:hypothetical protein
MPAKKPALKLLIQVEGKKKFEKKLLKVISFFGYLIITHKFPRPLKSCPNGKIVYQKDNE